MATVGRIAGVTQVTVSRALSDPSKVSPETMAKIQAAIEATGFVPNALAGALASQRSHLVSALVPSITNIVYATMVKFFSDKMREQGYQILLSETGFDPEEEEKTILTHLSRRPDALLLTGIHHTARTRRLLLAADIPVVEVWDHTDTPIDACVGFKHSAAGSAAAEFAFEKGYMNTATVFASDERAQRRSTAFDQRYQELAGKPAICHEAVGVATIAKGRSALASLLDQEGFKNGLVFCSSDVLAHGVMIEAAARGLNVPGQIAVLGFGDQEFAVDLLPALSTISVDRERLGAIAAETLLARFDGADIAQRNVFDLGFSIVQRATT